MAPPHTRRARRADDPDGENGGIVLPWVGPAYKQGGVCVLAINFNVADAHLTNLMFGFELVFREYLRSLRANQTLLDRSRIPCSIGRGAGGLLDVLGRRPVKDRSPREAAKVWPGIAQLQAIKCVPVQTSSSPHRAMWDRCPDLLLADELAVLAPSRLLVLGGRSLDALAQLDGWVPRAPDMRDNPVGAFHGEGWAANVYGVAHPAAGGAQSDQEITALLAELAAAHPAPDAPARS